jgi:hypothetical protein
MFVLAIVSLIIVIIGLPLLTIYHIYTHIQVLDSTESRHYLGFLWGTTRRDFWFWEPCIVLIRKLCIALVTSLLDYRSAFIPMLIFVIIFFSIVLGLLYRPYIHLFDNRLELALLFLSLWSYLSTLLSSSVEAVVHFDLSVLPNLISYINIVGRYLLVSLVIFRYGGLVVPYCCKGCKKGDQPSIL